MQKLFTVLLVMLLSVSAANAYRETGSDASATAGEQNTNFYKLNNKSTLYLKKLKKIDDYIARSEAVGKTVNAASLNNLLMSEQEDNERRIMEKILSKVDTDTAEPKKLIVTPKKEVYANIVKLTISTVKDTAVALQLSNELRRTIR